jgi:hypothetical protein
MNKRQQLIQQLWDTLYDRSGKDLPYQAAAVRGIREQLDIEERRIVDEMRAAGNTWQQVADALGVSRQAAHQRFS